MTDTQEFTFDGFAVTLTGKRRDNGPWPIVEVKYTATGLTEWVPESNVRKPVRIHSEIKVCDDCMFVHANGECDPDRPEDLPMPWERWDTSSAGRFDIAMGGEHGEHCTDADRENGRCDCEITEFSTSACQGCGDTHHGTRHTFTVFYRD